MGIVSSVNKKIQTVAKQGEELGALYDEANEPDVGGEKHSASTVAPTPTYPTPPKPAPPPQAAVPVTSSAPPQVSTTSTARTAAPTAAVPDYSGVISDIKSGYDTQRQKAASQEAGNLQGQRDALNRRFAAMGGGPGGAQIKADQQAGNESAQRLQQADADINTAQSTDLRGLKMTQLGQQFQASQQAAQFGHEDTSQDKSIETQKELANLNVTAQSSAADKANAAQIVLANLNINAQSALSDKQTAAQELMDKAHIDSNQAMQMVGITAQKDIAESTQAFQAKQASKDRLVKVEEFLKTMDLEQAKFDEQTGVDGFNERMASFMAHKKDMLEGFFSNFSMDSIGNMFSGDKGVDNKGEQY